MANPRHTASIRFEDAQHSSGVQACRSARPTFGEKCSVSRGYSLSYHFVKYDADVLAQKWRSGILFPQ